MFEKCCLTRAALPAVLAAADVEAVVRHHLKGNRNYTIEIHRILSLELLTGCFLTEITAGTD